MSLRRLLEKGSDESVALGAPDRPSATHADLRAQVDQTVATLNRLGVGPRDRVAVVLSNGPEMASAFLGAGATCAVAPFNPSYRAEELEPLMRDIGVSALIFEEATRSPSVDVALGLGIKLIELVGHPERPAGSFDLIPHSDSALATASGDVEPAPDDIVLLLHTSGTTARPKVVPLTHANLAASTANIISSLQLGSEDVCLNVMPLFHIHGLVAAVISPLAAGGGVFATPGFNAFSFFRWMKEAQPSWYSAVPSMHQAILSRAGEHRDVLDSTPLRFIRSSSSALPSTVFDDLERVFEAPVTEAYGMTEACHQITSNPLPPRSRKRGTVGLPFGTEVGLLDGAGSVQTSIGEGEIVIKGPNMMGGYEGGVSGESAFTNGWFRTGDLGALDVDGYLRIRGRLKEMINRGGEKVSPIEVDDILLQHEGVAQALTFAFPHSLLGEEVAALVVPHEGISISEQEVRNYVAERLAPFKVPKRILIVESIPLGKTGKPQRIGMAEKMGLA